MFWEKLSYHACVRLKFLLFIQEILHHENQYKFRDLEFLDIKNEKPPVMHELLFLLYATYLSLKAKATCMGY